MATNYDLKWRRITAGMTQAEAATEMSVARATYNRWETGAIPMPPVKWAKFCRLVGVAPSVRTPASFCVEDSKPEPKAQAPLPPVEAGAPSKERRPGKKLEQYTDYDWVFYYVAGRGDAARFYDTLSAALDAADWDDKVVRVEIENCPATSLAFYTRGSKPTSEPNHWKTREAALSLLALRSMILAAKTDGYWEEMKAAINFHGFSYNGDEEEIIRLKKAATVWLEEQEPLV